MAKVELTDVNPQSLTDILAYPSIVNPNFYLFILGAIWLVVVSSLYGRQVLRKGEGNILTSMAFGCFFITILSIMGSMIGLILFDTFLKVLAFTIVIMGIWWFNK